MTAAALRRILYVEDEPDIGVIAKLALEEVGGFTVEVYGSGEEAIERLPDFAPDLVLLDVMMPGMDGPTTFRALRQLEAARDTPIIFMTAKIQADEVARYEDLGALGVILKPFDPMTLADEVRAIWEQSHSAS